MPKLYQAIGMGGTFDHFHVGHRHFLMYAAQFAEKLVIGITIPELSAHKVAAELIEPLTTRWQAVEQFLQSQQIPYELFELKDTFGPTLEQNKVQAVAVTEQTVIGGDIINQKRAELGLPALPIHVCSLLSDKDGNLISSTRIRRGEINREGFVYASRIRDGIELTQRQLSAFKDPQGPVVKEVDPSTLTTPTFAVGDIVSETFLTLHWPASLFIFDQKNLRHTYTSTAIEEVLRSTPVTSVENHAGEISKEVADWLHHFCQKLPATQTPPAVLKVNGEEDLLTVAAVLLAPLGTRIYYGQPQQGMVEVIVTEEVKQKFSDALS